MSDNINKYDTSSLEYIIPGTRTMITDDEWIWSIYQTIATQHKTLPQVFPSLLRTVYYILDATKSHCTGWFAIKGTTVLTETYGEFGNNSVASTNHTLKRKNISRSTISKHDVPDQVWEKYARKCTYPAYYLSQNK